MLGSCKTSDLTLELINCIINACTKWEEGEDGAVTFCQQGFVCDQWVPMRVKKMFPCWGKAWELLPIWADDHILLLSTGTGSDCFLSLCCQMSLWFFFVWHVKCHSDATCCSSCLYWLRNADSQSNIAASKIRKENWEESDSFSFLFSLERFSSLSIKTC